MAAEYADLVLRVRSKDVDKAKRSLDDMSRSSLKAEKASGKLSKATSFLTSKMGAFVGIAGAFALIRQTKETIEFADAIGKTADKLGVSTDALQEYRFAAERTGVPVNALDMGLQRFSRRLAEADKGTGELKGTLDDLGISTRDSNGNLKDSETVLTEYADAIQSANGDQEKLRLAFKAFDSEGAAMVNMLRNGSQGLEELRQKARDAGVVIDEQLIRKAEIMNDKWDTLTQTIGTKLKTAILSVAGPLLNVYTDTERLVKVTEDLEKVRKDIAVANKNDATRLEQLTKREMELELEHTELIKSMAQERKEAKDKEAEEDAARLAESFRYKQDQALKEQELLSIATAFKQLHEEEARRQELASKEEHDAAVREATAIAQLQQEEQERMHREAIQEIVMASIGNLSVLMASDSKKAFKLGKAAALAHATITGIKGVQDAWAAGMATGGPSAPLVAAAYAASAAAKAAVPIQLIKNQKFTARATGGRVSAGDRVLVGERGPEVIEMGADGNVINNNQIGGNRTANVTFVLPADEQIKSVIRNNRALLFNVITDAMNEEGVKFA